LNRRRALLLLLLGVLVYGFLTGPRDALAGTISGWGSNGQCVTSLYAWEQATSGYTSIAAKFTLTIDSTVASGTGGSAGREWGVTYRWLGDSGILNIGAAAMNDLSLETIVVVSGFSTGNWGAGVTHVALQIDVPQADTAWVCVVVSNVVISQFGSFPGPTLPPTPTPAATPTAAPTPCINDNVSACGSPPAGECWEPDGTYGGGQVWYPVPCTGATPTPTLPSEPPLVCGSTTIPITGPGTWNIAGTGSHCRILLINGLNGTTLPGQASFSGSITGTVSGGHGTGTSEVDGTMEWCSWDYNSGGTTVGGACINGGAIRSNASTSTQTWSVPFSSIFFGGAGGFCAGGTSPVGCMIDIWFDYRPWPFGNPTISQTTDSASVFTGSFTGTIVIGTSSNMPSAVPLASCDPNAPSWYCAPPSWWAAPPSYPTPGPGGATTYVNICPPGTNISACATWPPTAPPNAAPTDQPVCDQAASAGTLMCATAPPLPPSPAVPTIGTTVNLPQTQADLNELQQVMASKAPFGWAAQVASAIDPSSLAGSSISWCMDLGSSLGGTLCLDPNVVSSAVTPLRSIFAGLLLFVAGWWVARRVWASVGGTPGDG
jgi:hypothetical protein